MAAAVEIVTEVCRRFADNEQPFDLLAEDITWKVPMLDQQDAFYVPLAGLVHVVRPGPNFSVYKHEAAIDPRAIGQ